MARAKKHAGGTRGDRASPLLLRACLALAVLSAAAPGAHAAVQRPLRVPGSGRVAQLYARSSDAFTAPKSTRPLLLLLRGFSCAFPPALLAQLPPGAPALLASRFFTGSSVSLAAGVLNDDIGALASAAADALDVVALVLDAPRGAAECGAPCATSLAAARAAPEGDPERAFTLTGAMLFANSSSSGADCPAWDATPACCQPAPAPAGDVPFLMGALDAALRAAPAANGSAVVAFGFSAGAFMALRLACDAPPGRLAAVVAFAGGAAADERRCAPRAALPVLLIHGARDLEVPFAGAGASTPAAARFPGAQGSLAQWARKNKCSGAAAPQRSLRRGFAGAGGDTDVEVVTFANCTAPVEGWLVAQWGHLPPRAPAQALFLNAVRRALRRPLQ
jgi:hypothetical protein